MKIEMNTRYFYARDGNLAFSQDIALSPGEETKSRNANDLSTKIDDIETKINMQEHRNKSTFHNLDSNFRTMKADQINDTNREAAQFIDLNEQYRRLLETFKESKSAQQSQTDHNYTKLQNQIRDLKKGCDDELRELTKKYLQIANNFDQYQIRQVQQGNSNESTAEEPQPESGAAPEPDNTLQSECRSSSKNNPYMVN